MRRHFEKNFSENELNRWFDPLTMTVDQEKGIVRIAFPHPYFGDWFMDSAREDFERHASVFFETMTILYENGAGAFRPKHGSGGKAPENRLRTAPPDTQDMLLHGHYRFDTFLVNRKNYFPLAAARECVSKASNPPYTPFTVYGQSGAGKSHLLGAMANALRENGGFVYFGGIAYLERISASPGHQTLPAEQHVFLDDTQRLYAYPEMQDALVAVIDMFQASGKLLALSFDAHPAQYVWIGHNLRSRLAAGLVVEIKRPDLDIRRQYVQRKNTLQNLHLTKEQVLAVSHRYQDIRSIDGALARLSAYRSLLPAQNTEEASSSLSSILDRGSEYEFVTPATIILTVARDFSLPPEELTGKSRDKTVALARHIAILLCRELLGLSLVQTGRIFSGRDHSSVLYSIKKIKMLQSSDNVMNKRVEELRKLCLTRR